MRINNSVVRRATYITRPSMFIQEPVTAPFFGFTMARRPITPPIRVIHAEIINPVQEHPAAPRIVSQRYGHVSQVPPEIQIHSVSVPPTMPLSGGHKRDFRILKANRWPRKFYGCYPACEHFGQHLPVLRGAIEVFPKTTRTTHAPYKFTLRDHRGPEAARG